MDKATLKKTTETMIPRKTAASPAVDAWCRCRAVLAVWTERQKPAQVCRELGIAQALLNHWQQRALEGMLQGLEPQVKLTAGLALSPRLQALLERKHQTVQRRQARSIRLEQRLHRLQSPPPVAPAPGPAKP